MADPANPLDAPGAPAVVTRAGFWQRLLFGRDRPGLDHDVALRYRRAMAFATIAAAAMFVSGLAHGLRAAVGTPGNMGVRAVAATVAGVLLVAVRFRVQQRPDPGRLQFSAHAALAIVAVQALFGASWAPPEQRHAMAYTFMIFPVFAAFLLGTRAVVGWSVVAVSAGVGLVATSYAEVANFESIGMFLVQSCALAGAAIAGRRVADALADDAHAARVVAESATADLAEANAELAAASEAKSRFLASMSHEIRTPMNGVLGMTELLLSTELDRRQRDFAGTIRSSGEALLGILNDILDFSKIEAGKMDLEAVDFRLYRTVEDAVTLYAARAQGKGVELVCAISPQVPDFVVGDPTRLRQVIANLVSNAVKFTAGGRIVVSVAVVDVLPAAVRLRVAVRDTGIGIPEQALAHLFDAFTQAESSTTREYGGTGLGLSICHQLVALMGGELEVASVHGEGTTFAFAIDLPLSPPELAATYGDDPGAVFALHGRRIVVLEPDPAAGAHVATWLESWGVRVESCDSLDGADALVRAGGVDAVVAAIEAVPSTWRSAVPVVLCAPLERLTERGLADRSGAAGLLGKPVRADQLRAVLAESVCGVDAESFRAVAARRPAPPRPTTVSGLRVLLVEDNPVNRRITRAFCDKVGVRTESATDGLQAVELALEPGNAFDVILMDCELPLLDGVGATTQIRADELRCGRGAVPILGLTASVDPGVRHRCLDAGMDEVLLKPISSDDLVAALMRHTPQPLHDV